MAIQTDTDAFCYLKEGLERELKRKLENELFNTLAQPKIDEYAVAMRGLISQQVTKLTLTCVEDYMDYHTLTQQLGVNIVTDGDLTKHTLNLVNGIQGGDNE